MKILAIDYGKKRIGLATGDSENRVALPKGIIENSGKTIKEISGLCVKEGIQKIIVGLPISLNGEENAQSAEVRDFYDALSGEISMPVIFIDERFSSVQAGKISRDLRGRKYVDDIAASLLLEQYFEQVK